MEAKVGGLPVDRSAGWRSPLRSEGSVHKAKPEHGCRKQPVPL